MRTAAFTEIADYENSAHGFFDNVVEVKVPSEICGESYSKKGKRDDLLDLTTAECDDWLWRKVFLCHDVQDVTFILVDGKLGTS